MMLGTDSPVTGKIPMIKSINGAHDSYEILWMSTMEKSGFGIGGTICHSIL